MRTNRKRVALPFLFRAADCRGAGGTIVARSYGAEVSAVFSRAGAKHVPVDGGALWPVNHSAAPLGSIGGVAALILDAAAPSNLATNASDFSNASWTKTNVNVSANSTAAPDGTTTADTLTTATAGGGSVYGGVTFTGDGTKWAVVYVQASGTAASVDVGLYDNTAATYRHQVRVTWVAGGVPTLSTLNGTGTSSVARVRDTNWFRVQFSANSVVAANANRLYYVLPANSPSAAVIAWQAFASDTLPGSGIEVGRVADSCYFPFTLRPQEMTVYVRGFELMAASVTQPATTGILSINDAANSDARLLLFRPSASTGYIFRHDPATDTSAVLASGAATVGDVLELRGVLSSAGAPTMGRAVNGGTEDTHSSTAQALASTWSAERLYLNALGSSSVGAFAFTHVAVALGTKTLAEMRELAEVY